MRKTKSDIVLNSELSENQNGGSFTNSERLHKADKVTDKSVFIDEAEKTELRIVDHSSEFEEVKSKILKIRDRIRETPEPILNQIDVEEKPVESLVKSTKVERKSPRKKILIGSIVLVMAIATSGFVYFNLFSIRYVKCFRSIILN